MIRRLVPLLLLLVTVLALSYVIGQPMDVGHCGCEGACEQCHHLCLECHCGSHIIDRGIKCQEFAACEAGCSGDAEC